MSTFLWVIVPYLCLAVFVVGHLWRYRYDKFGWTTRSSQLYENRLLRLGSPLFHFGMLGVVGGHVIGLLVPESWTDALGVTTEALEEPRQVEAVYETHPDVLEIAVLGVPDERWGEVGRAYVALRAGSTLDEPALIAWGRDRLATFKVPRSFVEVDEWAVCTRSLPTPRTPTG